MLRKVCLQLGRERHCTRARPSPHATSSHRPASSVLLRKVAYIYLRTFALIVCAQRLCAGNATAMSRITLRISYDCLVPKINMTSKTMGKKIQADFTPLDHR